MNPLPEGLIFEIARLAEITMKGSGAKRTMRCPFHDDKSASAFLSANNVFYCSVCTPGGGRTAKKFAEALGMNIRDVLAGAAGVQPYVRPAATVRAAPSFSARMALQVWTLAKARCRDDNFAEIDADAHSGMEARGLVEAFELGGYGVIADGMPLPSAVASWVKRGYRVVCPLYDLTGSIIKIQGRSVTKASPKVMTPRGSTLSGTVFANASGVELLRGQSTTSSVVVMGEGLTDSIALTIAWSGPVLAVPGSNNAVQAVGPWARGRVVLLALDCDAAGENETASVGDALFQAGAVRVRRVRWPKGCKDACDVVAQRGVVGLWELLQKESA